MGSGCFQLQAFITQQRLSCCSVAPKAGAQLHANAEDNNEAAAGEAYRLLQESSVIETYSDNWPSSTCRAASPAVARSSCIAAMQRQSSCALGSSTPHETLAKAQGQVTVRCLVACSELRSAACS
eukprot:10309-Heterococcus_DN1.PRE.2